MQRVNRKQNETEKRESPFEEQGYMARIISVVDLGKQPQIDYSTGEDKEPKYEMMVTFEFPEVRNQDDKPCWLSKRYQFPLAWPEKTGFKNNTNIYKLFNMISPRHLTQSKNWPAYYFVDWSILEYMLGKPVYIEVVKTKNGGARIASVSKLPGFVKAENVPELENEPYVFVTDDVVDVQLKAWERMFDWQRGIIAKALDDVTAQVARTLDELLPEPETKEEVKEKEPPKKPQGKKKEEPEEEDFDDDIPF